MNRNINIKLLKLVGIVGIISIFITLYIVDLTSFQYQLIILIIYFFTIIIALRKNYIVAILYLISLFMFMYGRLILLPLFDQNTTIMITWFKNYSFTNDTVIFIYKILLCNIFGILFAILSFRKNKIVSQKIFMPNIIKKILFNSLIVTGIFFCINNYFYIKNLYMNGRYLDIYLGENFYSTNFIFLLIGFVFYPILIVILSLYGNDKKYNKIFFGIYIATNFVYSLRGPRSSLIASIFVVIYFTIKKIKIKNVIQLIVIFFILVFFSQFMLGFRGKYKDDIRFHRIVKEFIYQQGITGTYLGLLKDNKQLFQRKIPYLFSSVFGKSPSSQADKKIDVLSPGNISLKIQLSARTNYSMYRSGMGMGGNYIIEMYDLAGNIGIFILSFLHMYLGLWIFIDLDRFKPFMKAFFILMLERYFISGRTSFFPEMPLYTSLCICIIYICIFIIKKKKGIK